MTFSSIVIVSPKLSMPFMPIADMLRNSKPAFTNRALPGPLNVPQLEVLVERGKIRLDEGFRLVDRQLADNDFVTGDTFSFADIDLMIVCEFAGWAAKSEVPADCTNIHEWLPRAQEAFAQK